MFIAVVGFHFQMFMGRNLEVIKRVSYGKKDDPAQALTVDLTGESQSELI